MATVNPTRNAMAPADRETMERARQTMELVIARLEREAEDRVTRRTLIENRWINDIQQYQGLYDADKVKELTAANKSTVFFNQTRQKTNACEARMSDMLFPTDDENWAIKPTPVPALSREAADAVKRIEAKLQEANGMAEVGEADMASALANEADQDAQIVRHAKSVQDEARKRSELMSEEIRDQLRECTYNIQCRDVIRDACKIGTGIMKGPVANADRALRQWIKQEVAGESAEVYALKFNEDPRPAYYRVDPWSFFPDSEAIDIEDSDGNFERHLMSAKKLRALARQPGFNANAIRDLLRQDPNKEMPYYVARLRGLTNEAQVPQDNRYHVWEYHGPISEQELGDICLCLGDADMIESAAEVDPLLELNVAMWFCQGRLLKFGIHHLDSGESIYSVFTLEKDDSSFWGYGIPHLMRDSQSAINGAWRMMMDNAGLSSGPQIEIDQNIVEPADNSYGLSARKIWLRKSEADPAKPGIIVHEISSHQAELAGIVEMAMRFVDDETSVSQLAQGEQGPHMTRTAGGMALLMNSVNVVFRRFVKNFDDDLTIPNIRRLYDWNMQFSPREEIKGDMQVDARGSSALLVREIQAQNLLVLANMTQHPVIGPMLKAPGIARKLAQSMMISADEIVLDEEEIQAMLDAAAQTQEDPAVALENLKHQHEMERTQQELSLKMALAELEHERAMMTLATQSNVKLEEIQGRLAEMREERKRKERQLVAEIAMEQRNPAETGGGGVL